MSIPRRRSPVWYDNELRVLCAAMFVAAVATTIIPPLIACWYEHELTTEMYVICLALFFLAGGGYLIESLSFIFVMSVPFYLAIFLQNVYDNTGECTSVVALVSFFIIVYIQVQLRYASRQIILSRSESRPLTVDIHTLLWRLMARWAVIGAICAAATCVWFLAGIHGPYGLFGVTLFVLVTLLTCVFVLEKGA